MSPALVTKYLDAAKEVAAPRGAAAGRVSLLAPHDATATGPNETLAEIREFYRQFTDAGGGDKVNLQGIVFDTNEGGRLPLEKYLAATLAEREALAAGSKTIDAVAREQQA